MSNDFVMKGKSGLRLEGICARLYEIYEELVTCVLDPNHEFGDEERLAKAPGARL